MILTLFQMIVAPIFALLAIIETYRLFRGVDQHGRIYWLVIWLAGFGFVVAPALLQEIASFVGIGRGTDLLLYVLTVAFLCVIWRQTVKTEVLRRDFTEFVRLHTINNAKRGGGESQALQPHSTTQS